MTIDTRQVRNQAVKRPERLGRLTAWAWIMAVPGRRVWWNQRASDGEASGLQSEAGQTPQDGQFSTRIHGFLAVPILRLPWNTNRLVSACFSKESDCCGEAKSRPSRCKSLIHTSSRSSLWDGRR